MERRDLAAQLLDAAGVRQHVVRSGEALRPGQLRGHDRTRRLFGNATPLRGPPHLLLLRAVDDEHTVREIEIRAGFEEQRHDHDDVRAIGADYAFPRFGADRRVKNRLQLPACRAVTENQRAHLRAVERAVGGNVLRSESLAQRGNRRAAGRGELVRDAVGIDDAGAERLEHVYGGRFAGADAAGQADYEHVTWNHISTRTDPGTSP